MLSKFVVLNISFLVFYSWQHKFAPLLRVHPEVPFTELGQDIEQGIEHEGCQTRPKR